MSGFHTRSPGVSTEPLERKYSLQLLGSPSGAFIRQGTPVNSTSSDPSMRGQPWGSPFSCNQSSLVLDLGETA